MNKRSEDPLTQSNSSRNNKSSSPNLNKKEDHRNRGIELILHGGKRKQTQPFHIIFEKMVCFLNREVTIYFEFSFKSRKRKVVSRRSVVEFGNGATFPQVICDDQKLGGSVDTIKFLKEQQIIKS